MAIQDSLLLPSTFENLYISILEATRKASMSSNDPARALKADGHFGKYDCYFFHKWVMESVPTLVEAEFLEEISKKGVTHDVWRKTPSEGITKYKYAQIAFEYSVEYSDSLTLEDHLREYIKYSKKKGASLAGIKGYEKDVDALLSGTPLTFAKNNLRDELTDSNHSYLEPREDEVIGRDDEIAEVLAFLNSTENYTHVRGEAGIGKTEVCKAALKLWLIPDNETRAFWVKISDDTDTQHLLDQLGKTVGLKSDERVKISEFSQLREFLPEALYYLDNVEHLAESEGGRGLLREFSNSPGIRVLASSRVTLDGVLGEGLHINRLSADDGCKLFLKRWRGNIAPDDELYKFVDKELGGHALCIALLARLGKAYSFFETLQSKWQEEGTLIARIGKGDNRYDRLEVSFSLTKKLLATEPGALDLWQFIALFPDGCDEDALSSWEALSGHSLARIVLAEHHLFSINDQYITMLSPIARYARDKAAIKEVSEHGFNWSSARDYAYNYFIELSRHASQATSNESAAESCIIKSYEQLQTIEQLIRLDKDSGAPNKELAQTLHNQLSGVYAFYVVACYSLLELTKQLFNDSLSNKELGHYYHKFGGYEQARGYYIQASKLYKNEHNQVEFANTLYALGSVEYQLENIEKARDYYNQADKHYDNEQHRVGRAKVQLSLGDLEGFCDCYLLACDHLEKAIMLFKEIGDQKGLAHTFLSFGVLENNNNNFEKADSHFDEAKNLFQEMGDRFGVSFTRNMRRR